NNGAGTGLWGDFFPSNVNLKGFVENGAARMSDFNTMYRFNGPVQLSPAYGDNGVRNDFAFLNPYDALWTQLGRRLGNPGLTADGTHLYQALPMTDSSVLASGFCVANSSSSASVLESYFPE